MASLQARRGEGADHHGRAGGHRLQGLVRLSGAGQERRHRGLGGAEARAEVGHGTHEVEDARARQAPQRAGRPRAHDLELDRGHRSPQHRQHPGGEPRDGVGVGEVAEVAGEHDPSPLARTASERERNHS